ncbi:peptidoglycan N-acetylglucosamine deacetylase [Lachnospiraceae bacterium KM106-2]|nr:peptidoglycan N-acetylglucosamine deacetylase [Lachnospiraceae bacterium KM106-2]
MKKKVGFTLFVIAAFVACYFINNANKDYVKRHETYGQFIKDKDSEAEVAKVSNDKTNELKVDAENELNKTENEEIKKVAYLTFDDGPSDHTKEVLATLKKYNIKATFFMIGEEITPEREAMVKEMVKEGHVIGVHTYCHRKNEMYQNKESCVKDFTKAYDKLVEVTGVKPSVFRFPYGSANCYCNNFCVDVIEEMDKKGLTYYDWNVSAEDAVGHPTTYSIMKNIATFRKYNEPVVLMHDGSSNGLTAKMLPQIIERIKAAGYEFDTVDKRSKPYQWPHDWQK